jgi:flavin reductase (DIM6/NTAB) family NADH-FMN oxidoreductase RutF
VTTPPGTVTTNQDLDPARLRQAFGFFPSGVVALAAAVDGQLTGLAASSFTSVSVEPPLVSVSIANSSKTWPDLRRAEHLGVTVLAAQHGPVCRQLAGPIAHRFDGVVTSVTDTGAVTLDEGLARFDCSIYREVEAGDHTIVLLRLHAVEHDEQLEGPSPLVFHRSRFGHLAKPA